MFTLAYCLVKLGIAHTTSCTIIFGPTLYFGLNLPELCVKQGTNHITYYLLLGHLCAQDNVGTLLQITLDTLQLHLGYPNHPLACSFQQVSKYIEPT